MARKKKADTKAEPLEPGASTPDPGLVAKAEENKKLVEEMKPDRDRYEELREASRLSQILKIQGPDAYRHKIDFMVTQEEEDEMREFLANKRGSASPKKAEAKAEATKAKAAKKTEASAKVKEPAPKKVVVVHK